MSAMNERDVRVAEGREALEQRYLEQQRTMPTIDEYLKSAWIQRSPGHAEQKRAMGFPTGFWTDVARLAMQLLSEQRTAEDLEALEAEAALIYKHDDVLAAHADLEMPYRMPELGYGKPARLRGKLSGKNKAAATADILKDIEGLF